MTESARSGDGDDSCIYPTLREGGGGRRGRRMSNPDILRVVYAGRVRRKSISKRSAIAAGRSN